MFKRKKKEMQSLLKSSRRALRNAETKIESRNTIIADMEKQAEELYEENKDLRHENEEQLDLIRKINKLLSCNKYNNERSILNKIKELISDFDG